MENTDYLTKMNDKYSRKLPEELNVQVKSLYRKGSDFQMDSKNVKAIESFKKAFDLIPEPKDQWAYTSTLLANIAENYFLQGFFHSKSPEQSKEAFLLSLEYYKSLMDNPRNIGKTHIHSRIGQIYYELDDFENAKEELIRVYMADGKDWFNDEKPEYYELIKPIVEK